MDRPEQRRYAVGTPVEVRSRFLDQWSRGFVVAAVEEDGARIRRQSDGALLPVVFPYRALRRP